MLHLNSLKHCWQTCGVAIALFTGSLSVSSQALAHALDTNYAFDLIHSSLTFTSTFSTGEPLQQGTVEIYAPGNQETPWATLETNEAGTFSFAPDYEQPGEWTVKIQQGGHTDLWTVPVSPAGVEFDDITEGGFQDIHYGNFKLWPGILLGAIAVAGGVLYRQRTKAS